MKKYIVNVKELLSRDVEVTAESKKSAIEIVALMYRNSEIVLDYSDYGGITEYSVVEK
ncbi:MAG: DpnD/PcfM family protein [Anaerorhabdus sp.]